MSVVGISAEAVPATTAELTEVARAVSELLDRVEALESQVRALASVLEADAVVGEQPEAGRGLAYVRSRVAAVEAGTFGERGLQKFAEKLAEARRPRSMTPAELASDRDRRLQAHFLAECRSLGARIGANGELDWVRTCDPVEARRRTALARQRAAEALAEEDRKTVIA